MVKSDFHRRSAVAARAAVLLAVTAAAAVPARAQQEPPRPPVDASRPRSVSARAFQFGIGFPGAFIKVNWDKPGRVPQNDILGYVVTRTDSLGANLVVAGPLGDQRTFVDTEAGRTIQAFDGTPGDVAGDLADFTVTGLRPGELFSYRVSSAYRNGLQDRDGDGVPDDENYMSPQSGRTRYITAIAPPTITLINEQTPGSQPVFLGEILVEWQQTPGADSYVIWVADNPDFKRKFQFNGGRSVPINFGGPQVISRTINANNARLRRSNRVFIAVGARNSGDPKPAPFGAIFSTPVSVQSVNTPPPPPGGGGNGGGGENPPPPPNTAAPKKKKNR